LVSARDPEGGVGLFLVPAESAGLGCVAYQLLDGRKAGELALDGVVVPAAARLGVADAGDALAAALDYLVLGLCAEAIGAMQTALDVTTDYLKTREQFGQPIGRFQALQHRMAEMLVEYEQSRSIFYRALSAYLNAGRPARRTAV